MIRTPLILPDGCRATAALIVFVTCLCGCGWQHQQPTHRAKVDQRIDANGRLASRTFDQIIEHHGRNYVVTMTQEFDTAGRLIVEYGADHPRLGKHYFYDVTYTKKGTVVNYFSWEEEGDFTRDTLPISAFREQRVWLDSCGHTKAYTLTRMPGDPQWLVLELSEPLPGSELQFQFGRLDFVRRRVVKIPHWRVRFDASRRLQLGDAVTVQ